jgi:hypothetical protein
LTSTLLLRPASSWSRAAISRVAHAAAVLQAELEAAGLPGRRSAAAAPVGDGVLELAEGHGRAVGDGLALSSPRSDQSLSVVKASAAFCPLPEKLKPRISVVSPTPGSSALCASICAPPEVRAAGARRQLDIGDGVALVFGGQERGGQRLKP